MKKIIIIGANDFQNQLIVKAKEKGYETHVFAWREGAPGELTADFFYPVSILEKEKILKECEKIKPDGIISIASDLASITVNYIAEKMGLIGNGVESASLSTDKYLMRRAFEINGDPSPKNYRSDELTDEIIHELEYPVIVKPVDRSGSRGITKVMDMKKLSTAVKVAEGLSFNGKAMIEEFVEGEEYSVEYVSFEGRHYFLALTKKFTTGAPHFIEIGHMEPAQIDEDIFIKVNKIIENALDTLKIRYGASHSEIKIDSKGNIVIIEIGGRMGGDCIGSDLVQISTGYDFVGMVIDIACGYRPDFKKKAKPKIARVNFILNREDLKRLEEIKRFNPEIIYRVSEIEPFKEGHQVVDSSTRYGYYITQEEG